MRKNGFTLLEINLAVFIMAVGTLAMCALYSLGFRESRQSTEDVAAAAFADAYLGPLVQGLSATNMTWNSWLQIGDTPAKSETKRIADGVWPAEGWMAYVEEPKNKEGQAGFSFRVKDGPRTKADGVFGQIKSKIPSPYQGNDPGIPNDYQYGLVATRRGTTIQLAFRVARRKESLMSQPLVVSEVRFQGVVE